jgi:acetoin utilization protein AcuC
MRPSQPLLLGHDVYRHSSYGAGHPISVPRVSAATDLIRAMGWLPPGRFRRSPRAKPAALAIWHAPDYLAALERAEARQWVSEDERRLYGLGTLANPVFPEMFRRPSISAGGSLLAGELLARGGTIHHPAGGTHHGLPARANGFCYLNDPVLALLSLRRAGVRRLAYVDIDAHHPDGVEPAFAGDPDILMISIHEENRWPFTGRLEDTGGGRAFNLPVPKGFNDSEMRAALYELILPRVEAFRPDAVILQCGADAVEEDPLSRLSLSNNSHWAVVAALAPLSPRYLVLGGGGYNPWAVARLWAGVWAMLAGETIPERLPAEAREVLAALSWPRRAPPAEALLTTLRDAPREGPVRPELRTRLSVLKARAP